MNLILAEISGLQRLIEQLFEHGLMTVWLLDDL